jgi:hypothetical protein
MEFIEGSLPPCQRTAVSYSPVILTHQCHPERIIVILSAAKDLSAHRDRPFAEFILSETNGLRVTLGAAVGVPALSC